MTTDTRCALTELLVDQCAHCRGFKDLPRAPRFSPRFYASYPGTCVVCDDAILPGDTIRAKDDDGYVCNACGGDY